MISAGPTFHRRIKLCRECGTISGCARSRFSTAVWVENLPFAVPAISTELWSAQALLDAPDVVAQVHRDYIEAGARIIISNSYSTIPSYLGKLGMASPLTRN